MNLLKSEWLKLIYARANWGLLAASVWLAVVSTIVTPFVLQQQELVSFGTLQDQAVVDSIYANAVSSYIFSIILGVLIMAGEFRHGTAVATFLTAPKRVTVLWAKLGIAAIAGALMQLVSAVIAIAAGALTLTFFDDVAEPSAGIFVNTLLAAVLSGAVLAVIGVALGTLIRNQLIAVVSALVWLFIFEPILLVLWPEGGKWFPTGAISAMLAIDIDAPELGLSTADLLDPLSGTLLLLGYGAVFAAVAIATSLRRDID